MRIRVHCVIAFIVSDMFFSLLHFMRSCVHCVERLRNCDSSMSKLSFLCQIILKYEPPGSRIILQYGICRHFDPPPS